MLTGAHSILYSTKPDEDRAFFRDVLALTHVDVGHGWLIFGLPPAEIAVHPSEKGFYDFYLMCDDIEAFVDEMEARGVACEPVANQGWGMVSQVTLPGGAKLGVYQPRHARPTPMPGSPPKVAAPKVSKKKAAPRRKAAKKPTARRSASRRR